MSKIHERKRVAAWAVTGAVAGGLAIYGALWLGRQLAAAPGVQRVARFVGMLVDELRASGEPRGDFSETVFQAEADPASSWTPHNPGAASPYGPN